MLNFLRQKKVMKRTLWVLAIIIILAFVLWGAPTLSKRSLPFKYIGTIEGKKIDIDSFVKSATDIRIGLFLNYFNQPEALDKIQKDRKLLNRLAWENLILNTAAQKDNVSVSDKEVVNFITNHPLFTRSGIFDDKLYNYILRNSLGMVPRTFEESVRSFLINARFKNEIIKNVGVSDEEIERFYKNEFEKARVYYTVIDKANFVDMADAPEDEITAFYEKNKERFKEPERVVVQYIAFPHKEDGAKEAALTNLKNVYGKLQKNPHNMEKIAKELNLTVNETLPFSQEEIVPEINGLKDMSLISFRLKPLLDILPIIAEENIGTSYIIRIKEKIPGRIKSKESVSPYIIDILKEQKANEEVLKEAERLYDETKKNNFSLNELAKLYNLKVLKTDLISRFDYIEGVGESHQVITAAFALKRGEVSRPIGVRKGFALIEPIEFEYINEAEFEREKESYRNKVLSLKKMKALEDWFEKAKLSATLNVDLDRI